MDFDPLTSCYTEPPWYDIVFVLYLSVVVLLSIARIAQALRHYWHSRRELAGDAARNGAAPDVRPLARLAWLTVLVSILVSAHTGYSGLRVTVERVVGLNVIRWAVGEALARLQIGLAVSTLLYLLFLFLERGIHPRALKAENAPDPEELTQKVERLS